MKYKVVEIVGQYCITADDGQKLYDLIYPELNACNPVELDFTGVKVFAPPFFNFALGQLLRDISAEKLNSLFQFTALNPNGHYVLEQVIANAKHYYGSKNSYFLQESPPTKTSDILGC